ncbi:fatty acid synthase-like isoform X2 [Belonocnema kinseyi]|uniref:fatty acid synthase-like isoform X2 n=1 Tax=Belonocnema kinseyi TaxID=2817044 RepID=UPI00143D68FE|nr:fatty acid synthase-like isoform X2 [Belonocnema kinseyi]
MDPTTMTGDEIVISGISGKFPNCDNIRELQQNLMNKEDCTTDDTSRWDIENPKIPQRSGKMKNIEKFDNIFFGVHAKLTDQLEPMTRMMLERTYEAVIDAGINPRELKGRKTAVIMACGLSESEKALFYDKTEHLGFVIIGTSRAMLANRISFFLGVRGTSLSIDSGDNAGGVVLEEAIRAIREGRCDDAIVGGLLSPDGRTKSFDSKADGYSRSEAVTTFFLQRARDAKRIYAEIMAARSSCGPAIDKIILIPTSDTQERVIRDTLDDCGLSAKDITYVEADGSGIKEMDEQEAKALDNVYNEGQSSPLLIGSVKPNLGHTFQASTFNSIIKVITAMESGLIPPTINYEKPSEKIPALAAGRLKVVTELTPWQGNYGAINTASGSGNTTHVILKSFKKKKTNGGQPEDDLPRLIMVSGRTQEAVESILNDLESRPVDIELLQLFYDIFEKDIPAHLYRGFTVLPSRGMPQSTRQEIQFNGGEKKEIWFVFSGMGSQWLGMGEALMRIPIFMEAVRKSDTILKPRGINVVNILTSKDPKIFENIIHSFVGIATVQIGLVDLLKAIGIEPDFMLGHSVGELGCAYADGCITSEEMVLAAFSRGLASIESDLPKGSMAAVGLGFEAVKPLCPPDIDIACHNSSNSSTISGPAESMKKFVEELKMKGIFAREVSCSNIAYHSRYIAPVGPKLLKYLQQVISESRPRSNRWISSSVPKSEWNLKKARLSSPEYHTKNLLNPVLFAETSSLIPANAVVIEIAPHGLLQAILKKSLPESCMNVPLTKRGHEDNVDFLMTALGKIYNVGLQFKIKTILPEVDYPVGRETPSISSLIKWDHSADWFTSFYQISDNNVNGEKIFEINLAEDNWKFLEGHRINGNIVVSCATCLKLAWDIWKTFNDVGRLSIIFEDVKIHQQQVFVPKNGFFMLTVMVQKGSGKFEAVNNEILIASGLIRTTDSPAQERLKIPLTEINDQLELKESDIYTELKMRGFQYSGSFRSIRKASMNGSSGTLNWRNDWTTFLDGMLQMYVFGNDTRQTQLPLSIKKILIDVNMQEEITKNSEEILVTVDHGLNLINSGGVQITGITVESVLPDPETRKSLIEGMAVIPYTDGALMTTTDILQIILQLSTEKENEENLIYIIEEADNERKDYQRILEEIAKNFKLQLKTVSTAWLKNGKTKSENVTLVIISDAKVCIKSDFIKLLDDKAFLLTIVDSNNGTDLIKKLESTGLGMVLNKCPSVDQMMLVFRKRKSIRKTSIMEINDDKYDWSKDVQAKLNFQNCERMVVLNNTKDSINYLEILDLLQEVSGREKIRFFDIRDPKASKFSLNDPFYQSQLQMDLIFNVLLPGKLWGSHRRFKVDSDLRSVSNWKASQMLPGKPDSVIWIEEHESSEIENDRLIKVEYSSISPNDLRETTGKLPSGLSRRNVLEEKTFGSEFSGLDSKGTRIMGICENGTLRRFIKPDSEYTWLVPESWNLIDAATVPLAYVVAYNALYLKADMQKENSVLIFDGSCRFGQAAINLAINDSYEVITTYANDEEKNFLHSRYPTIPESNIFPANNSVLRNKVLDKTKGEGVDIIICNNGDSQTIETALMCAKQNSPVVVIDDIDDFFHESVGLKVFLREISLYSISPKRVTSMNKELKRELADMIKDGIAEGVVKPLSRKVYPREMLENAFHDGISKKEFGTTLIRVQPEQTSTKNEALAVPRVYCSSTKTYLIIEGLTDFGLELIDFLVVRGARNIVISSGTKSERGYCKLRLELWRSYGVNFIIREDLDLSKRQNVKALMKETASLGIIDAIFDLQRMRYSLVNLQEASKSMNIFTKFLDEESRQACPELRKFVVCSSSKNLKDSLSDCLLREARVARLCEKRCKDGLPGLLVLWSPIDGLIPSQNLPVEQLGLEPIPQCVKQLDEVLTLNTPVVLATSRLKCSQEDGNADEIGETQSEAAAFKAYLYKNDPLMNYRYRSLENC